MQKLVLTFTFLVFPFEVFSCEKLSDPSIKDDFGLTVLDWTSDEGVKEKITKEIVELLYRF